MSNKCASDLRGDLQIIQGSRLRNNILRCYFVAFSEMKESGGQMKSLNAAHSTVMEPQSVSFNPDSRSPKLGQSNFRRVTCTEDGSVYPIPGLATDILHMRVKEGSKIRNLLRFATTRMQGERRDSNGTSLRQVVFTGSGRGLTKTITCVEIMKREVEGLHQVSKLYYKTVNEVRENPRQGAPDVTMQRTVPAICILLSKDPLDPQEAGYQPPQNLNIPSDDTERRRALVRPDLSPSSQHTVKRLCRDDLSVWSSWSSEVRQYR